MGENLRRRIVLLQIAAVHHGHLVCHGHGLELVVRHIDNRRLQVLMEPLDFGPHLRAQLGVEIGERFVHQEYRGVANEGAAQGHALLLSARELTRPALEQVRSCRARVPLPLTFRSISSRGQLSHLQRERQVLVDRLLRIERVVLEHHCDVTILGVEVVDHPVPDQDFT